MRQMVCHIMPRGTDFYAIKTDALQPHFIGTVFTGIGLWFEQVVGAPQIERVFHLIYDGQEIPEGFFYVGSIQPYRTAIHLYQQEIPEFREPWLPPSDPVAHSSR